MNDFVPAPFDNGRVLDPRGSNNMETGYGRNPAMRFIEGAITHPAYCPQCMQKTPHHHLHDCAHGIPETYMPGTERYECTFCHTAIHKDDRGELNRRLRFMLDR